LTPNECDGDKSKNYEASEAFAADDYPTRSPHRFFPLDTIMGFGQAQDGPIWT
jgi:hypothetical protein